jgi:hypothetical protein
VPVHGTATTIPEEEPGTGLVGKEDGQSDPGPEVFS